MTTMVERMAAAMKKRAAEPWHNIPNLEPIPVGSLGDAWLILARSALESLGDPTDAMVERGNDLTTKDNASAVWGRMIDAAIKEGE